MMRELLVSFGCFVGLVVVAALYDWISRWLR